MLISILLMSSCISKRDMLQLYGKPEEKARVDTLNGMYSNNPKGMTMLKKESLWYQFQALGMKEKFDDWKRAEVKLDARNRRKIIATVYVKDVPIETKELKGKFKNDCFLVKRKIHVKGVPLIFFKYDEKFTMLTFDEKNRLMVHTKELQYGGFFVFLKGKKLYENYTYRQKRYNAD